MFKFKHLKRSEFLMLVETFLYKMDFFGNKPAFRILKRSQFITNLGLMFSVGIIVTCFSFLLAELLDLSNRANPQTRMAEKRAIDTEAFPLLNSNFTLAISLVRLNFSQITSLNTHFTLTVKQCLRQRQFNETSQLVQVVSSCIEIPTEPCSSRHSTSDAQKETFSRIKLGPIQCLNANTQATNPPILKGSVTAVDYYFLEIEIKACKNTSTIICAPQEEIEKELNLGYYTYYLSDNLIQLDQQLSTFEQVIKQQFTLFSIDQSKQILTEMRIIETETDEGLVVPSLRTEKALTISKESGNTQNSNGEFIIYHAIFLENRSTKYSRQYQRIQDILGAVGGLWEALYIILSIFLYPFSTFLMNVELINKIFSFGSSEVDKPEESIKHILSPSEDWNQELKLNDLKVRDSMILSNRRDSTKLQNPQNKQRLQSLRLQHKYKEHYYDWRQRILILCGCDRKGKKMIQYAADKFMSKLDIVYMVRKFYEIEQLKMILLSNDQLNLFNIIQKPVIPLEIFSDLPNEDILEKIEQKKKFKLMLGEEKSFQHRLQDAWMAYTNLITKEQTSARDKSILEMIDPEILNLFECKVLEHNRGLNNEALSQKRYEEDSWQVQSDDIQAQKPIKFYTSNG